MGFLDAHQPSGLSTYFLQWALEISPLLWKLVTHSLLLACHPLAVKWVTAEQPGQVPRPLWLPPRSREVFETLLKHTILSLAPTSRGGTQPAVVSRLVELVPVLIRDILDNPPWLCDLTQKSYGLPNGFLAMRVLEFEGYVLRLHVFNQKNDVEGLHSHKWAFESAVLTGRLVSEDWRRAQPGEEPEMITGMFERIKSELNALQRSVVMLQDRVGMVKVEGKAHTAGQSYFMADDVIHRVMPSDCLTGTLVLTHPPSARAFLYDLPGQHQDAVLSQGAAVQRQLRLLDAAQVRAHLLILLGAMSG